MNFVIIFTARETRLLKLIILSLLLSIPFKLNEMAFAENIFTNIPSEYCTKTFVGTIGGNFHFQMNLQRQGDQLIGSYFYTKYPHKRLWLEGHIAADGTFSINEYIGIHFDDVPNGRFDGRFLSWEGAEGLWLDAHQLRSYHFKMTSEVIIKKKESNEGLSFRTI